MHSKPDLTKDFEQVNDAADAALMRLLKQAHNEEGANSDRAQDEKPQANATPIKQVKPPADDSAQAERVEPERAKKPKPQARKGGGVKPAAEAKAAVWGQPTALFNTRIPPEMAALIDDLIYRLRKQRPEDRSAITKQSLAKEALEDFLRKHQLIR